MAQIEQDTGGSALHQRSKRFLSSATVVALTGLATLGLASTGATAASKSDPGVTAKSVKLGYIFSETGVAGSTFKNAGKACQARIDARTPRGA